MAGMDGVIMLFDTAFYRVHKQVERHIRKAVYNHQGCYMELLQSMGTAKILWDSK
jgi:hypothetical protein